MQDTVIPRKKGNAGIVIIIIAVALGLGLLIFGNFLGKEADAEEASLQVPSESDTESFARDAEERIVKLCSSVSGAGQVSVVVSLSGGYRAVYAENYQSGSNSYRNETVLTGSGSSEKALLVGYENPTISGIGIVCTGGDDPVVQQKIISLVSAAFDVSTNKIYVVGT